MKAALFIGIFLYVGSAAILIFMFFSQKPTGVEKEWQEIERKERKRFYSRLREMREDFETKHYDEEQD